MNLKYIISGIHLLSPLFFAMYCQSNADYMESFPDSTFFDTLAGGCLIAAIIVGYFFSDKISQNRTGRSFRTKSGVKFDEYKKSTIKAPEMGELTNYIFFIHVGIVVIFIISIFL